LAILFFGFGEFNSITLIVPIVIISLIYLLHERLHPLIKEKRKKRLIEFFKTKYVDSFTEQSDGDILFDFQDEKIWIEYHCDNINGTYLHNSIHINIDVTGNQQRLIDLIKIHFNVREKYDKIWIEKIYRPLFRKRSMTHILKKSEKEIIKAINDYRNYIDKKTFSNNVLA
jgi:hypothetical protein